MRNVTRGISYQLCTYLDKIPFQSYTQCPKLVRSGSEIFVKHNNAYIWDTNWKLLTVPLHFLRLTKTKKIFFVVKAFLFAIFIYTEDYYTVFETLQTVSQIGEEGEDFNQINFQSIDQSIDWLKITQTQLCWLRFHLVRTVGYW